MSLFLNMFLNKTWFEIFGQYLKKLEHYYSSWYTIKKINNSFKYWPKISIKVLFESLFKNKNNGYLTFLI